MAVDAGGEGELGFPYWVAVRRRFEPIAPFFAPGNLERELLAKQVSASLSFSLFLSRFQSDGVSTAITLLRFYGM